METKSRYEVIADLENKKRDLIQQKRSLSDEVYAKEQQIKIHDRQVEDTIKVMDRQREDLVDNLNQFKETLSQREETLQELIDSVDKALEKFNK